LSDGTLGRQSKATVNTTLSPAAEMFVDDTVCEAMTLLGSPLGRHFATGGGGAGGCGPGFTLFSTARSCAIRPDGMGPQLATPGASPSAWATWAPPSGVGVARPRAASAVEQSRGDGTVGRPESIAAQVFGPAIPSGTSARSVWKATTPDRV